MGKKPSGPAVEGSDIFMECYGCGDGFRVGSVTRPEKVRDKVEDGDG